MALPLNLTQELIGVLKRYGFATTLVVVGLLFYMGFLPSPLMAVQRELTAHNLAQEELHRQVVQGLGDILIETKATQMAQLQFHKEALRLQRVDCINLSKLAHTDPVICEAP